MVIGVKESDTGLAAPNLWDIPADKQRMQEEQPLQVYIYNYTIIKKRRVVKKTD